MAKKKNTDSYFAKLLKRIPIVGKGVKSAQNYYFNKGLKGEKEDSVIKLQKKIQAINPRPIDFSPTINRIKNPIVRAPVSLFGNVASEMLNVPTRLAHYGYRAGEADKPQELIGALSGVAGAAADLPFTAGAFNLGKQALKSVGKRSISQILREGAKQGIKGGGILGGLYGAEQAIDAPDLKTQALSALQGAGTGAALGGVVGAGISGLGVAGGALKDFGKYLQDPNYKTKTMYKGQPGVKLESSVSIGDILKKKKNIKPMDFSGAKNDLLNSMKQIKGFDANKATKALEYAEKRLGSETLAELQFKNTSSEGLNLKQFWSSIRQRLGKQNKGNWEGLLKYVDEQMGNVAQAPIKKPEIENTYFEEGVKPEKVYHGTSSKNIIIDKNGNLILKPSKKSVFENKNLLEDVFRVRGTSFAPTIDAASGWAKVKTDKIGGKSVVIEVDTKYLKDKLRDGDTIPGKEVILEHIFNKKIPKNAYRIRKIPQVAKAPINDIQPKLAQGTPPKPPEIVIPKPPLMEKVNQQVIKKAQKTYTSIENLLKKMPKDDPLVDLKKTAWRNVRNKKDVAGVFADVEARVINLGRNMQESLAKKGISNDDFVKRFEAGDHTGIEAEVNLHKQITDILAEISPVGDKLKGKQENYFHRFKKDAPMRLEELYPSTYFDVVDKSMGFKMRRTGKMTDYELDIPTQLAQLAKETLYDRYGKWFEADNMGKSVERIEAERGFTKKLVEAIKKADTNYSISKEAREILVKEAKAKGTKPPKIKVVKGKIGRVEYYFDTIRENLKAGGIDDVFKPLRYATANANAQFKALSGTLGDMNALRAGLSDIGFKDSDGIARWIASTAPEKQEALLNKILYRKLKTEALDNAIEFMGTHRFESNDLQNIAEWTLQREIAVDVLPETLVRKLLGATRNMYYRGAIGLNIRSAVNNLLETKRALAVGKTTDFPEAFKYALSPSGRQEILAKYGVNLSSIKEAFETRGLNKKAEGIMSKVDPVLFKWFQSSEELKDAVLLRVLEKDGMRKGFRDEALQQFVIDGYDKFAHKYGTWGTVGIFRDDYVKTLGQFGQYPLKELGLIVKQGKKGGSAIGQFLKGEEISAKNAEGLRYMMKLATTNVALTGLLGSIYGASAEEIWGASPVQFSGGGLSLNISPAATLVTNIANVYKEYEEALKNDEIPELSAYTQNNLAKSAALMVPGGNQLLLKTGVQHLIPGGDKLVPQGAIGDMLRGYNPTASGNVRYLAPESLGQQITSLAMGPYAHKNAQEYFKEGGRAFGANQTGDFKTLWETGDTEGAKAYYDSIIQEREQNRRDKMMAETGVYIPSDYDQQEDRKQTIIDTILQGFRPKEAKSFLNEMEPNSTPFTQSEINEVYKEQEAMSIGELLSQEQKKKDRMSVIDNVYGTKGKFRMLSEEQKQNYLQSQGITQEEIVSWQYGELAKVDPKEKAQYIMSNKITDFTSLYKEGAIKLDDLKELQRQGYIRDASDLWDKLKMTDVYYQQEELKKNRSKFIKDYLKLKNKAAKDVRDQQLKTMEQILKVSAKYQSKKLPERKYKNYAAELRKRL